MKLIAPDYYKEFRCIASDCRHSCCVGWEIDIDSDTLGYYKTVDGALGKALRENIRTDNGTASFILDKDERCPFLDSQGLCRIISTLGEAALCNICADHPRFRNYFSDRTEIGLGLCCEAAAELILSRTKPMELTVIEDDSADEGLTEDERSILKLRNQLIAVAQDREFSIEERLENLLDLCGFDLPEMSNARWAEVLFSFERLDSEWDNKLSLLACADSCTVPEQLQLPFEQLLVYLLYRHLPAALDDGDYISKVGFAIISVKLIAAILNAGSSLDPVTFYDTCRLYSSEIEYSDENLNLIFDMI